MPLNTFVVSQKAIYADNNSITPFFNAVTFGKLLGEYQRLQNYDGKLQCKTCARMGRLPQMICCDASSLLLQKKYIQGVTSPKDTVKFNDITINMEKGNRKVKDVYISQANLRKRLDAFLIDHKVRNYRTDDRKSRGSWIKRDRKALYRDLNKHGYGKLLRVIIWTLENKKKLSGQALERLGDVLRGCSRYVPVYHLVPNPIVDELLEYSEDNWDNIKMNVNKYQPAIYSIHELFRKKGVPIPPCWIEFVKEIAGLSRDSIAQKEEIRANSPAAPAADDEKHQSLFEQSEVSGCCYGYPVHHTRPTYDYHSEKIKNYKTEIKVGDCSKYFHKFDSMSNGIVIFKCIEHEEIMGFHVMRTPEGLNDYFSVLMMIYPDYKAPTLVLGDVGCQLERYCMNREPTKFKNTIFLNDEMHAQGHKCGPLYNVKYFKDALSSFAYLNDPSIEQTNRICKYLKISTMYMKLSTFMRSVCNLLEIESRKSIIKRQSNE